MASCLLRVPARCLLSWRAGHAPFGECARWQQQVLAASRLLGQARASGWSCSPQLSAWWRRQSATIQPQLDRASNVTSAARFRCQTCPGSRALCTGGSGEGEGREGKPLQPPPPPGEKKSDPGHGLFKFKELHENPWTVPNLLCVCRILLAPFLGHLIIQQHFHLSLALFTLAGATDVLDGYIARTWPAQKSALGSALDPLADKILISVLYVSLTYAELIPAPLTALVIFRDIGLIAAVFWVRYKTVPPPVTLSKFFNPCYTTAQLKPTLFSKVNTVIQLGLVAASLAAPVFQYTDSILLQCLWYVTAVTTTASGYSYWHYGRKTVRVLNTKSP
ncbi:cardiolipin synthase (CMP-forming) [Gouania willdenowi]|uniref:Cardiolipin synthase (CMP-forming) n=1 Tax=Gouania willdenowi TaxID=441366 RepID=A0A8C5GWM1_GOUWI|nr:cardiolipin synthase (CMP-forming) [Gouania willdenowi]